MVHFFLCSFVWFPLSFHHSTHPRVIVHRFFLSRLFVELLGCCSFHLFDRLVCFISALLISASLFLHSGFFSLPPRSDQRQVVLGWLKAAHALQRRPEWRQQEEGAPVLGIPGPSVCSHSVRGRTVSLTQANNWIIIWWPHLHFWNLHEGKVKYFRRKNTFCNFERENLVNLLL